MESEKLVETPENDQGPDPIGDLFGDIFKGAGALITETIKIVSNAADGSVSTFIGF